MVSKASVARRIVMAAAYGGGGVSLAGVAAAGLLLTQVKLARHAIPQAESPPPRCDGLYGGDKSGEALRVVMLGDSTAAGYGVATAGQTPAALIAAGLVEQLGRPVWLRCFAVVGAASAELPPQVDLGVDAMPDVAVIVIGANDVTHLVKASEAVRHLAEAVRRLTAAGAEVVVGTCPDLGTVQPIQPPLRWLARNLSRQLAAAQTMGVVEEGGRSVSLGDLLGPRFSAAPLEMFSADRFHPSAAGYAAAAEAMLPTVVAALAETAAPEAAPIDGRRGVRRATRSLERAAAEAAAHAGTEVSGDGSAAQEHSDHQLAVVRRPMNAGRRWAQIRRWARVTTRTDEQAPAVPLLETGAGVEG